jgi:hypothetical protein
MTRARTTNAATAMMKIVVPFTGLPAYALTGCAGMSLRGSSHDEDRAHRAGISVNGGKPQEKRRADRFLGGGIEEQPVPVSALANEVSGSPI